MEDRYLFRAKRMDTGEWVEGNLVYTKYGYCICKNPFECMNQYSSANGESFGFGGFVPVDSSTICQCTGFKDKNGKMIWENDILRYSYDYPDSPWLTAKGLTNDDIKYSVGAVFWREWRGSWAVCGNGNSRMTNQNVFVYCRNPNRTEVIGNIFDNPELLER